ncbi:hypothetical protein G8C92_12430 [Paenibacillus donghaensis]|uniref:hypothetical protein n=1 Tax=Paenibacillus donghaensis TaxID=414771 RepID=UPI0018840700|nr:hypothetical protein [Paenibacillus donghaensis]MBE9914841.1 hypothetical protein [Paenibacillus donghaensis]
MNMKKIILAVLVSLLLLLLIGCAQKNQASEVHADTAVSHSWAYEFVHWNDVSYRLTDIKISKIAKEIGKVESLLKDETVLGHGVYSNRFAKGTKLYSIPGISTDDAIAVKTDEGCFKMINAIKERTEQEKPK